MRKRAMLSAAVWAGGTCLVTLATLMPGSLQADSPTLKIEPAVLRMQGAEVTLRLENAEADKTAGVVTTDNASPTLVVHARNTSDQTIEIRPAVDVLATSPKQAMSRTIELPKSVWKKEPLLTLAPGAELNEKITVDIKLPAGQFITAQLSSGEVKVNALSFVIRPKVDASATNPMTLPLLLLRQELPMRARFVGIIAGLILAGLIISMRRPGVSPAPHFGGKILSECDGTIHSIVIQYCQGSEFVLPVYRQFLAALPAEMNVYVLTPDEMDFANLRDAVSTKAKLISVVCGHPITCWSRDRWVTLSADGTIVGRNLLLCPRAEDGMAIWPQRAGDQQVASDLSRMTGACLALRSEMEFDGGDFLADGENVFVTPAVAQRNIGREVRDLAELRTKLAERLGKKVVLLDDVPPHHAGMFMASVGEHTMLVGDPSLGRVLSDSISEELLNMLPNGPDFTEATQKRFDRAAEQAREAGYRVIRIPTICSPDGKTYLTYVNGIIDNRAGEKCVYMPMYKGAEAMNASAAKIWRDLGYTVTPIDCTSVFTKFGTLHCLVNVLERS